MITTTTYLFAVGLVICSVATQAQSWEWATKLGNTNSGYGLNVSVDSQSNCLVATGIADSALGTLNVYFTKLDSTGATQWGLTYGNYADDYGQEIITDNLGNYYLLGAFQSSLIIGNDTLISSGAFDVFVAKLDANLNVLWAKSGGSTGSEEPFSIRLDNLGNCYMTTPFQNTAHFDNISLVSAGGFDIALVKFDSNGNVVWAKQAGGVGIDTPRSISLDVNGNIIMGGNFSDNCSFGATSLTSAGAWDAFIAKYDSSGTVQWAKSFGGPGDDVSTVVQVGIDNNIYLVGNYAYTANFDAIQLTSLSGSPDIFVAKYETSSGNILWAKSAGSPAVEVVYGMTLDNACNLYFTGYYGSDAQFGSISVPGSYDVYVAKYDSSGTEQWVKTSIGQGPQHTYEAWSVAVANDNVYITGSFSNDMYFDNSTLMLSPSGAYVAKITQTFTGIDEVENEETFNIYPNPCTSCFLQTKYASDRFMLIDITGRNVPVQFHKTMNGYSFTLPKSGNIFLLRHIDSRKNNSYYLGVIVLAPTANKEIIATIK